MKKMKVSITASILILFLLMVSSCSGSFIDPGIMEVPGLGGSNMNGSGGGSGRTPVESDYTIENLSQLEKKVTDVIITVNSGKSPGAVKNIRYNLTVTVPQAVGSYSVLFDVEKAMGWDAAYNLSAGTLVVRIPRTVTFDINGGAGITPASQIIGSGASITLPGGSGFSRSGFEFGGWSLYASGAGTIYNAGQSYTVNSDITYYARWKSTAIGGEANPRLLTIRQWAQGSIDSDTYNSEVWYFFNVLPDVSYHVYWNDSHEGNTTKTLDVMVSAYHSDGTIIFSEDNGYSTPRTFTPTSAGIVLLRVYPYYGSGYYGTFSIVFTTAAERPAE
jgi:hypothetical protein